MKTLFLALLLNILPMVDMDMTDVAVDGYNEAVYTVIEVYQEDSEMEGLALGHDVETGKEYLIDSYHGIRVGEAVVVAHEDDDIIEQYKVGEHSTDLFEIIDAVPSGMEGERVVGSNVITGETYLLDWYEMAVEGDYVFAIYSHDDLIRQYLVQ